MDRRRFLQASLLSAAAAAAPESPLFADSPTPAPQAQPRKEQVDFGYAFAPPHRMTVARPEASEKTLLDLEPGLLTLSWSYDDLRTEPLCAFKTPRTGWRIKVRPLLDGKPFPHSNWRRGEDFLPMLDNLYSQPQGTIQLQAIGAATGALVRVRVKNSDSIAHRFSVVSEVVGGWINHNPAWIEPGVNPDALVAGASERPDRVLLFGAGADEFPVDKNSMTLEWTLKAGETRDGWLVRTYAAYEKDLAGLRKNNWSQEFETAKEEWKHLLGKAISIQIPDGGVRNAFYSCLGELFIMREPLAEGYVGMICGTEVYRGAAPIEPTLSAIALDQTGYHAEAANGLRVHLEMQEPDGNWDDPKGWNHHMWCTAGFKARAGMEHFRLTGDRSYLASLFPRLAASSRWQDAQRKKSRVSKGEGADAIYGLMPRGMGDGGLMNGTDYFGVFYTHNIMAVYADDLTVQAAEALGETGELAALRKIHDTAVNDLRAALRKGAIHEADYQWIPDSAGNLTGSRWGALYTLTPSGMLEPDDPLVMGTLKKIEHNISPGGQPVHTGWMEDGAWVACTLDYVAQAHLALGHGDTAISYLYSSLNHGTPLYTWCEERGQEPGSKKTSGDRQHLWTPVAVVLFLRNAMVMEQPDGLHLALGSARSWLRQGGAVGIRQAPTHFGDVSYRIESDLDKGVIRAEIEPPVREQPKQIVLHLRHPLRKPMQRVTVNGKPTQDFDAERELVRLAPGTETLKVEAFYQG